jgi:hypothetical protein
MLACSHEEELRAYTDRIVIAVVFGRDDAD